MKQILTLLLFVLMNCSFAFAQSKQAIDSATVTTQSKDAKSKATYTPTYTDTNEDGITVESVAVDEEDEDVVNKSIYSRTYGFDSDDFDFGVPDGIKGMVNASLLFSLFIIILVFGFPLIIIFLALYFRNKNRRERYKLVEKAIEAGQPIPDEIIQNKNKDNESAGIKDMCVGIGLFIFLWAITSSFGIGCIGMLVFFSGLGKYMVARRNKKNDSNN